MDTFSISTLFSSVFYQKSFLSFKVLDPNRYLIQSLLLKQKNEGEDTLPLNRTVIGILKTRAKIRHIKADHFFLTQNGG
jgi:hypothetical protein